MRETAEEEEHDDLNDRTVGKWDPSAVGKLNLATFIRRHTVWGRGVN